MDRLPPARVATRTFAQLHDARDLRAGTLAALAGAAVGSNCERFAEPVQKTARADR